MPSALVTGGAVRLGRAMALHLARKGYGIALHYHRSNEKARAVLDEIERLGVQARGYPADFTDLAETVQLAKQAARDFPDLELLVNSAANFIPQNVENTETASLADTMNINLLSPYLLMRDYKRWVNRGMVVNILDERVMKNIPTFAAYSVSKVGLEHLTRLAAVEWGERVRVNAIAPGLILPPPGRGDEYLKREAEKIPLRTHGSTDDICRALDYLLLSPFVTGETLFVDGGGSRA
ncbi:MAG: SDR family oxidoreductase [Nitrospinaceae bacterium]|jgi:NAD(P)-dependent dehydrogenase (short-subunit alcohol dehydrogenase family)|nr:MAG: SDR family oxidoreductase [Nitrospinaceae bacterium]